VIVWRAFDDEEEVWRISGEKTAGLKRFVKGRRVG
jgi:hypothetical protein